MISDAALDDIIICGKLKQVIARLNKMNFYDFNKDKGFLGFESGVVCFYPTNSEIAYLKHKCVEVEFFKKYWPNEPIPTKYDPRCRPWYKD